MSISTEAPTIIVTVTETTVSQYRVTEDQLKELDLPFDVAALELEDADDVAVPLEEHLEAAQFAVTDREVAFRLVQQ